MANFHFPHPALSRPSNGTWLYFIAGIVGLNFFVDIVGVNFSNDGQRLSTLTAKIETLEARVNQAISIGSDVKMLKIDVEADREWLRSLQAGQKNLEGKIGELEQNVNQIKSDVINAVAVIDEVNRNTAELLRRVPVASSAASQKARTR